MAKGGRGSKEGRAAAIRPAANDGSGQRTTPISRSFGGSAELRAQERQPVILPGSYVFPGGAEPLKSGADLCSFARSLERMARSEIERIDGERPNDPEQADSNRRQRELLTILADGFARIAAALEAVAEDPHEPALLGKAREIVTDVGEQITRWWKNNAAEAIDWAVRIPVVVASIPMLGWAGADMTVGTTIIGAIVGGEKVATALARRRKPK
jgi:hypothetical protein